MKEKKKKMVANNEKTKQKIYMTKVKESNDI